MTLSHAALSFGSALLLRLAVASAGAASGTVACDIVVAGGSTASLAAAITAAEAMPEATVCFTEITDWPGGQMTAGGVPAIDFGGSNKYSANQPASFRSAMASLGPFDYNPGFCSVSTKCYEPNKLVAGWIMPRLDRPNLRVLLRAAVVNVTRAAPAPPAGAGPATGAGAAHGAAGRLAYANGSISSVTVVQRTPRDPAAEWSTLLSQEVHDWYDPEDSAAFTKQVLTLTGSVFIEATELGDVLATARAPWTQGPEVPTEYDWQKPTLDQCGQAWTTTLYMTLLPKAPPSPAPVPRGSAEGFPFPPRNNAEWLHSWTWRRAWCAGAAAGTCSLTDVNVGDVTQQNLGNDLDSAYPLGSTAQVDAELAAGAWRGGVNTTAFAMLEGRAYGWYWWMKNNTPSADWSARIALNYTVSGTRHGLSKWPYLRDSRRAVGLGGYRLPYPPLDFFNTSAPSYGEWFNDTVALGDYNDDVHHLKVCTYPPYVAIHTTKPYFIPFRALTVLGAPNLLVAGKSMSQTFHAQGATRLHPSEWTTGVAAGGAAVFMLRNQLSSTAEVLARVQELRAFLNSSAVGQPLAWTRHGSPTPPAVSGSMCGLGRCFSTDAQHGKGHTVYPSKSGVCAGACPRLKADEWLAEGAFWALSGARNTSITATRPTILKKSVANSRVLPPDQMTDVPEGAVCDLEAGTGAKTFASYYLCTYTPKPPRRA